MKQGIHPKYDTARIHCACGVEVQSRSTRKEISVEVCSSCHPFYTGEQRLMVSAGRIEKFMKKYGRKA